jgi:hypothetical protein
MSKQEHRSCRVVRFLCCERRPFLLSMEEKSLPPDMLKVNNRVRRGTES